MKCQSLFSERCLLKFLPSMLSVRLLEKDSIWRVKKLCYFLAQKKKAKSKQNKIIIIIIIIKKKLKVLKRNFTNYGRAL